MIEYITRQGDMLDWICWKHYGTHDDGTLEIALAANAAAVAENGSVFPAGVLIVLPAIDRPAVAVKLIRLWD